MDSEFFSNIPKQFFKPELAEHMKNISEDMTIDEILTGMNNNEKLK